MGWRGVLREIQAAQRRAEREEARRRKAEQREEWAIEVDAYNEYVESLISVHRACSDEVNWKSIAETPEPNPPSLTRSRETSARRIADEYTPGIFDKLLRREQKRRRQYAEAVRRAAEQDKEELEQASSAWQRERKRWNAGSSLARRILRGESSAKIEAIRSRSPFSTIARLGSEVRISIEDESVLHAFVSVHGRDVVPDETRSLLASGKLSKKKMPVTKFNELYQDYVCSCVLRVARELFAVVPDDLVIVTAQDDLLDKATGHKVLASIVSVAVSRGTLHQLNLSRIDPSDAMTNFVHRMNFKKRTGFAKVSELSACDFQV